MSFGKDTHGATAIEFALVALPFFTIMFAIIEIGFAFLVNVMLDNAVINASRLIRTGQAEAANFSADEFAGQVCNQMPTFLCQPERILVDVSKADAFANPTYINSLYDSEGNLREEHGYDGKITASDIVVVNVIYKWPMFTSLINLNALDHGNERHLSSTMVFRNEPYK